jgi:hypothetical protein
VDRQSAANSDFSVGCLKSGGQSKLGGASNQHSARETSGEIFKFSGRRTIKPQMKDTNGFIGMQPVSPSHQDLV